MFGILASASGSFATILAMTGVIHASIWVMISLNPQKESEEFGTSASTNGSLKFGTNNAADGRMNTILAPILARREDQELQAHQEKKEDTQAMLASEAATKAATEEAMEFTTEVDIQKA